MMYCQNCRTPLRLDPSLQDLNPAAFKLIVGETNDTHFIDDFTDFNRDSTTSSDVNEQPARSRTSLPPYQQERLAEYDAAAKNARPPQIKRGAPPAQGQTAAMNPAMSFVMLSESQIKDPSTPTSSPRKAQKRTSSSSTTRDDNNVLGSKMEAAGRVFEILSARSDIDHPICVECTDLLVEGLQKRLNSTNKERDAYVEFLRQANSDIPSTEEVKAAEEKLRQARKKEKAAMQELEKLEAEKAAMEREILELDAELSELDVQEEKFWAERNAHALELAAFQNERDRINTQFDHDNKLLTKLQGANVYNDVFSIGYDNYFGTINGLRLGRLPDRPVDWAEINAAWGQTCLLLDTVADKLDFKFAGYSLRPMGSTSKIIEHLPSRPGSSSHRTQQQSESTSSSSDRDRVHELFSSGEYAITIGLFNRRFDNAMVVFLECLRQLIQHTRSSDSPRSENNNLTVAATKYKIDKDRIGDCSIRLGGMNKEENWTQACKYVLICCKTLIAHTSNVSELRQRN